MKTALIVFIILFCAGLAAAQALGELVGTTLYPYQNTGPTGRRIVVSDDGSIYVCWTKLFSWPYPPAIRHVYYNWRSPENEWLGEENGYQVSENAGAGYCNADIIDGSLGAIIYHQGNSVILSAESYPGFEIFNHFIVPNEVYPQNSNSPGICMWPQMTIDRNAQFHVLMTEATQSYPRRLVYTRSVDSGYTWFVPIVIDTITNISGGIESSPVSDRVAISFTGLIDSASQYNYWPFYIISDDGETWNVPFDIIQVPYRFHPGNRRWGNNNQTAIFDCNDNLHIAWPVYGDSADWLLHYDVENDTITAITELYAPPNHPLSYPMIQQVSLSRKGNSSTLFATWCQFAEGDTSTAGVYNGDIYMCRSDDLGITWQGAFNVTNTSTPRCGQMECSSEIYPSTPEEVDMVPQCTYIYDPFLDSDNYPDTQYSVMYFEADDLVDIPSERDNLPIIFALDQNYPNPFNARTEIKFNLKEAANIELSIFDILGRQVETLINSYKPAGSYSIFWNAADLPSGVYPYKLRTDNYTQTRKCLLLK